MKRKSKAIYKLLKQLLLTIYFRIVRICIANKESITQLQSFILRYGAMVSHKEILFLSKACCEPIFTTKKKKHFLYKNRGEDIKLTFVVLVGWQEEHLLERCLFSIEKQTEKSFEVIIVGKEPVKRYASILKMEKITYITLVSKYYNANILNLIFPYIRGKLVIFIQASDVVHPSLAKHSIVFTEKDDVDLVVCSASSVEPLPASRIGDVTGRKLTHMDMLGTSDPLLLFTERDICHKVFVTSRLKEYAAMEFGHPLTAWMVNLQALHYCLDSCHAVKTDRILIKTCAPVAPYPLFRKYAESLKLGFPALYAYLHSLLPRQESNMLLHYLVFTAIPLELSRLYGAHYSSLYLSVIYSHIAFYLDWCRNVFPEKSGDLMSVTFAGLHYGRYMSSPRVHAVHAYFIDQQKQSPEGICLYENEGYNDIALYLFPLAKRRYRVEYIQKHKFCEYSQLELMVFAIIVSRTVLVVASFWMHKYAAIGRKIIQVWHGSGMMKKILMPTSDNYMQEYALASSEACREEYAKIFLVPEQNVLTFGTIQTDCYFDRQKIDLGRAEALEEFDDVIGKRICFYAPTFRQFNSKDLPSLFCGWDYKAFDDALEASNSIIVYKKHHMLKNLTLNKGINLSDLHDSPQKFVRETGISDIFPWVCACDIFMTDYSSSMFFPMLLNKPIIFYAPDLDEFLTQGNGTLIDYEKTVPGPIVRSSSISELMQAMDEAPSYVGSEKYRGFKEFHMGACDGKACERLMAFIGERYPEERRRLSKGMLS